MHDDEAEDREPAGELGTSLAAGLMPDGYTTHVIPPDLLCREDRVLWERVRMRELLGLPPANAFDALIRETLQEARKLRGGESVKVAAVLAAVRLELAAAHGIKIQTHARGVALHLGIRYQTLLALKRAARRVIVREGDNLRLQLPEWLHWELS